MHHVAVYYPTKTEGYVTIPPQWYLPIFVPYVTMMSLHLKFILRQ